MPARIEYSPGDVLNKKTGTIFLEEIEVPKGQLRKARCKCGYCGNEDFIITIKHAKRGVLCPNCKTERSTKRQLIQYHEGEILNQETKTIFLKDIEFISGQQRKAWVQCGYCHNIYVANINNIKNGSLCPNCRNERASQHISESAKEFFVGDIIENPFGAKFVILDEYYNNKQKRRCIFAPIEDGKILKDKKFESCIHSVKVGEAVGKGKYSFSELTTKNFLENNNIDFVFQKSFEDLFSIKKGKLFFDFAITLNDNQILLIELDGPQHFFPIDLFGGESTFLTQKKNDEIKNFYVEAHKNLFLERVPYFDFPNLEEKLEDILLKYNIIEGSEK